PNVVRRFFGYHTPIVMQNLGSAAATATVRFVPFDGGAATTTTRTLQPGQSRFIEPNIEPGLVDGRQYAATITSTQPLAAVVNTQNDDPDVANPVAYATDGIASAAFAAYGAYAAKNANDSGRANTTSTIVVQNVGGAAVVPAIAFTPLGGGTTRRFARGSALAPGAAWVFDPRYANGDTALPFCVTAPSATLTWRSFRTGLATSQTVTLMPPAAVKIDPRGVPGLTDDTQYSVSIAANRGTEPGNISAAVIELADGADNAMMYEGF